MFRGYHEKDMQKSNRNFYCVWLTAPAYASDPCASVLCLYGKAVGQGGGSECRSAEKDFLIF